MPTEPAYPLHPNAKGEASMARSAIAQLGGDPAAVPTGSAGGQESRAAPAPSVLPPTRASGARAVGRVRLGLTRRALARRVKVAPARRSRLAWIWCTKGATGRVAAVFSKRSSRARVEMIITTAPAKAVPAAVSPSPVARTGTVPKLAAQQPAPLRSARGRVLFVAVMRKSLFRQPKRLGRDFRLALG